MRTALRLLALPATFAALCGTAAAADYNPPIFIEQAPEYVPVEIGSGWYLRGDVTYLASDPIYDFDPVFGELRNNRFGGSVGMGYHFNDLLRTDVNIGFVSNDRYRLDGGAAGALEAEHKAWYGMANAYLDLGTLAGFTPYVGAGIGVLNTRQSASSTVPGFVGEFDDSQYRLAYALNAGVNYRVGDNLSIDLGYQYLASPKTDYLDFGTGTFEEGVDYHQVKVGLRYDLW